MFWRQNGIINVGFQPPYYIVQQPIKQLLSSPPQKHQITHHKEGIRKICSVILATLVSAFQFGLLLSTSHMIHDISSSREETKVNTYLFMKTGNTHHYKEVKDGTKYTFLCNYISFMRK